MGVLLHPPAAGATSAGTVIASSCTFPTRLLHHQRLVFLVALANAALPIFSLSAPQELIVVIEQNCISILAKLFHIDDV